MNEQQLPQKKDDGWLTLAEKADEMGLPGAEIIQATKVVATFCSWARDMSPVQIMGTVVKARSMGVNPANPYEFQAWKNPRTGQIVTDYAYTMYLEWLKRIGRHTKPRFYRLLEDELAEEMLDAGDVAYRVKFIMYEDLPLLQAGLVEREDIEREGLGVMTVFEIDKLGKNAAPKGRSIKWKVEKRAMVDAIRRNFGTPNPLEVQQIRTEKKWDVLTPEDFAKIEGLADGDTLALAEANAQRRETPQLETQEQITNAASALYGSDVIDVPPEPEFEEEHLPDEDPWAGQEELGYDDFEAAHNLDN